MTPDHFVETNKLLESSTIGKIPIVQTAPDATNIRGDGRITPGKPDIITPEQVNYIIFPVKAQVPGHFYAQNYHCDFAERE